MEEDFNSMCIVFIIVTSITFRFSFQFNNCKPTCNKNLSLAQLTEICIFLRFFLYFFARPGHDLEAPGSCQTRYQNYFTNGPSNNIYGIL